MFCEGVRVDMNGFGLLAYLGEYKRSLAHRGGFWISYLDGSYSQYSLGISGVSR